MSFEDAVSRVPQAYSVKVLFCENPRCLRPHVVLLDEGGAPIAQFVCPPAEPDGTGFFRDLQDALYRSAVERNEQ